MESAPARTNGGGVSTHRPAGRKPKKGLRTGVILAVVIGTLLLGGLASWLVYQQSTSALIDRSKYQAVFFTNGQVYFGKLRTGGEYMKLSDVYYIQAKDAAKSDNPQKTDGDQGSDLQLIKLGNEVHGPEDQMNISKDQVLFFENLKDDGDVARSITEYKKQQND